MKQREALRLLRVMQYAIQKVRSNTLSFLERAEGRTVKPEELSNLNQWLWGNYCPLEALSKLIDRAEAGTPIAGTDFYNMMLVAHLFLPELAAVLAINGNELPEPDLAWAKGLDKDE